jgi:DNA-binding MarR family transcriptional regulator
MNSWSVLTSVKRTSVALERRADDLLRARALQLTQLRLLIDIDDRHAAYSAQLAKDLLMSRQAVHHQLAALDSRGALRTGSAGNHVRRVALTSEGRDLAERGLRDLAPLLDRLAQRTDADAIVTLLSELAATTRPPPPRWEL